MPEDVITPPTEEVVETPVEETPKDEVVEETPKEEEPAGPSAEELKNQLDEAKAENERLKAESSERKPEAPQERRVQHLVTQNFIDKVLPAARKAFTAEDTTSDKQFDTIIETVNQMIGAVQTDQIRPQVESLATALIEVLNELEIRDLRGEVQDFKKAFEKPVRDALSKVNWKDRGNMDAVRAIYHRIKGAAGDGEKVPPKTNKAIPGASGALKDLSAGKGGAPTKTVTVRLTEEQEQDRKEIEEETGVPHPPEKYFAKLKARQDKAKAAGKRIPNTLRELV